MGTSWKVMTMSVSQSTKEGDTRWTRRRACTFSMYRSKLWYNGLHHWIECELTVKKCISDEREYMAITSHCKAVPDPVVPLLPAVLPYLFLCHRLEQTGSRFICSLGIAGLSVANALDCCRLPLCFLVLLFSQSPNDYSGRFK